ncbi:MAG TPA: AAA family ATPase, partial [Polyangiales bacterium]
LSPAPQDRPSGRAVLAALDAASERVIELDTVSMSDEPAAFVGRHEQLEQLSSMLAEVRAGETRLVELYGPSGIGKTELARRFLVHARTQGATILESRCHPRETVVFNAVDGLIDCLSAVLAERPSRSLELDTEDMAGLGRLFPVLDRSPPAARALLNGASATLYRRAFSALRSLFARLSQEAPLVLFVDDAQWADADSIKLLRDLIRPPGQLRILLLFNTRAEPDQSDDGLRPLLEAIPAAWAQRWSLQPLSAHESLALARSALGPAVADGLDLNGLLKDAAGLPFFVREVSRFLFDAARAGRALPDALSIASLLRTRLQTLSDDERTLLDVAALAGGPLDQSILLRAAGLAPRDRVLLNALTRSSMLTAHRGPESVQYGLYHHLIRLEVTSSIPAEVAQEVHRTLADAMLAETNPNLMRVVEHYEAAEAWSEVRRYVVAAAEQASSSLAFELAVRLYRRALEIGETELSEQRLLQRLAESHADAGWGVEAGRIYEASAEAALRAGDGEHAREAVRLSAEQYLQAGENAAGLRLLKRTLAATGLELPRSPAAALRALLRARLRLAIRGSAPRPHGARKRAGNLERTDAYWLVWRTITLIDHTVGIACAAQFFLECLDLQDDQRLLRGYATEAVALSATPTKLVWPRVDRMLEHCHALSRTSSDRVMRGGYHHTRGVAMWFRGELRATVEHLDNAIAEYRRVRRAVAFDIGQCEAFRVPALSLLGDVKRLRAEADEIVLDARRRGDRFVLRNVTAGQCSVAWIAYDECDTALELARDVFDEAESSGTAFSIQHYHTLIARTQVALYRGQSQAAWQLMDEHWENLVRGHILLVSFNRDEAWQLRSRAALAYASELPAGSRERQSLLKLVRGDARRIRAHGLRPCEPWAALLLAGVERLSGHSESAAQLLQRACAGFDQEGMQLYASATRFALGSLLSGGVVERLTQQAQADMWAQGIKWPAAVAAMLAPGAAPACP